MRVLGAVGKSELLKQTEQMHSELDVHTTLKIVYSEHVRQKKTEVVSLRVSTQPSPGLGQVALIYMIRQVS